MDQPILFEVEARIATITLNRPDKLNAFTLDMIDLWADRLEEAIRREDVHVIVITGAGRSFCAGGDIGLLMKAGAGANAIERRAEVGEHVHRIPRALTATEKPVLAAINGPAIGAGLDLVLGADLRFAARSARFAETYVRLGLTPGAGGAYFLPRRIGMAKALELFWSCEPIDAAEAERIGLVNLVLEDEALMPFTRAFAARLAALPTLAVRATKRLLREAAACDLPTALDLTATTYGMLATSADHAEAVDAFLAKRTPAFTGR
jgi:2-(1,2-epoxy-1,2-dihydrophenyl)acetyl-CoA isomerase